MEDKEELREKILGVLIDEYKQNCNYDALMKIMHLIDEQTRAAQAEVASKEFEGAWGITNLTQLHETLEVAENGGDIRECSDALKAILVELSKDKDNHDS